MFNPVTRYPSSISVQMNHAKNEAIHSGILPQRNLSSTTTERSLGDQRVGFGFQNPLHVGTTNPSTNTFTARNTATLFSETVSVKQPLEQLQSAFRRPLSGQENIGFNQQRSASQNLLISQTPQKSNQNGPINGYQQQSSNGVIPRSSILADSYSCMYIV